VTFQQQMYTTEQLYKNVLLVFNKQPEAKKVSKLAVSCFELVPKGAVTEDLFESNETRKRAVSDALDQINDRYGEYVITPALMLGLQEQIVDRIAFGGAKEIEDLYR